MKKDKFYRACSNVRLGKVYKEEINGYTKEFDDVVLHAYKCFENEKRICVIEGKTGFAIGYFFSSFKKAFDDAYQILKDAANFKGETIPEFLSGCEPVDKIALTYADVFFNEGTS